MEHLLAAVVFSAVHRLPDQRMSGFWLAEVAYPWLALAAAGWKLLPLSTSDTPPCSGGVDRSDRTQRAFLDDDDARRALAGTRRPAFYDPDDFRLVLFAGGAGVLFDVPGDTGVRDFTRRVLDRGGIVSGIGYGVAGLLGLSPPDGEVLPTDGEVLPPDGEVLPTDGDVLPTDGDVLRGRRIACPSPGEEQAQELTGRLPLDLAGELAARGARVRYGPPFRPHVEHDGQLITGQNPGSAPALAHCLVSATAAPSSGGASVGR